MHPKKNFLSLSLTGEGMNRFGIGAKAYLWEHLNSSGSIKLQRYQELMLTRGFPVEHRTPACISGLDSTNRTVDSLLVVWPDQKFQVIKNVAANREPIVLPTG